MQTIQSRIYTNVILTVIAALLGVLAFQHVFTISTPAYAQREEVSIDYSAEETRRKKDAQEYGVAQGDPIVGRANEEIAKQTGLVADALAESGKLQADALEAIAIAITALAEQP